MQKDKSMLSNLDINYQPKLKSSRKAFYMLLSVFSCSKEKKRKAEEPVAKLSVERPLISRISYLCKCINIASHNLGDCVD